MGDANIFIPRNALALGAVRGGVPQYFFALEGLLFFMVFVSGYCVFLDGIGCNFYLCFFLIGCAYVFVDLVLNLKFVFEFVLFTISSLPFSIV